MKKQSVWIFRLFLPLTLWPGQYHTLDSILTDPPDFMSKGIKQQEVSDE